MTTMESESTGPSWVFVQTLTHEGASFHVCRFQTIIAVSAILEAAHVWNPLEPPKCFTAMFPEFVFDAEYYMWAPLHTPSSKYHTYIYRKEIPVHGSGRAAKKAHGMT